MNREKKIDLLKQIAAGTVKAKDLPEPLPELHFKRLKSGLFKCRQTGELLTLDEVRAINDKRPAPWQWFRMEEKEENGQITKIVLGKVTRRELLEDFSQDDFLQLLKAGSQKE